MIETVEHRSATARRHRGRDNAPLPRPLATEATVEVRALCLGSRHFDLGTGDPREPFPLDADLPVGTEVSGTIVATGSSDPDFQVGAEVFGTVAPGSTGRLARISRPELKAPTVSWELAASLPAAGSLAFLALRHLAMTPGETLLVHGAAETIGAVATQLCVARGVTVIGTAAEGSLLFVTDLGAIAARSGDGLVARVRDLAPNGIDAALDTTGRGNLPDSIELIGSADRVLTLADPSAVRYGAHLLTVEDHEPSPEALPELGHLASTGALSVPVWASFAATDAVQALAELRCGNRDTRIVLVT